MKWQIYIICLYKNFIFVGSTEDTLTQRPRLTESEVDSGRVSTQLNVVGNFLFFIFNFPLSFSSMFLLSSFGGSLYVCFGFVNLFIYCSIKGEDSTSWRSLMTF